MVKRTNSAVVPETQHNPRSLRWAQSDWPWAICVFVLIGMAVVGIENSWTALSATYDEPYHVANGIEWLGQGTQSDLEQPPLAQGAIALGPYLKGIRSPAGNGDVFDKGVAILQSGGDYRNTLKLARLGVLPFFVLACVVTWLWARRWFGRAAAIWAVLLFVNLPPILGHAGLATVDMAGAATVAIALYAFMRCLENSEWQRLILLGVALALAFLCKFSSLGFLGSCFLCAFVYVALGKRCASPRVAQWRRLFVRALIVSGVAFVLLWAGYRFSWRPISDHSGAHSSIDRVFAKGSLLRSLAYKAIEVPLPLRQFVWGIHEVESHNAQGSDSYLFGEYRKTGWWYFFPVVVGVKTPIGFLILAGCGIFAIMRGFGRSSLWQQHLTVIFPASIMLVCISSRIDLGVRHILAIYPLLAVIGGHAMAEFFILARRTTPAIVVLPIMFVAWAVADSWMTQPDYLAYFNEFAGSHPERILAESDLDWGQDLDRLSRRLKELEVDHVSIKYFGTGALDTFSSAAYNALLESAGLPPHSTLSADVPTTHGYVAISLRYLTLEYAKNGSFAWLKGRTPVEIIGKSIYLYNF